MAEGKTQSYEKAELAMKLMDLKFDEEEAIYAANECTSLYTAISYLQQDCELCASKYGVKDVIRRLIHSFINAIKESIIEQSSRFRWCRCFTASIAAAADALAPTSALKSATAASWTLCVLSAKYPISPTRT